MNDYIKEEKTIDIIKANIYSIPLIAALLILFGIPFYFFWGTELSFSSVFTFFKSTNPLIAMFAPLLAVAVIILGIALHEVVHGITWLPFTEKGFKSIKFGILWKYFTPYCHCDEPLKPSHFIAGAIMPTFLIGLVPAFASLITGNFSLLIFGILFTASGIGDIMIICLLLKEKDLILVEDHPTKVGFFIYRNKN